MLHAAAANLEIKLQPCRIPLLQIKAPPIVCTNFAHKLVGAINIVVGCLLNGDAYGLRILPVGNVQ